ncbi:MAG: hypothetical protein PHI12_11645 [Dehalococcoidales bacterium]|nr:hypothetical protein [Dehalococcoidales bacterium]
MAFTRLKDLKVAINKAHGAGTIDIAKASVQDLKRISVGSLSWDRALGGGIPAGRVTIFRGNESSGKTVTAYKTIANAQRLCANCFRPVFDMEFEYVGEDKIARATCDCYAKGLYRPARLRKTLEDGKVYIEKDSEYKERLKGLEENSFSEFRVALVDIERALEPSWAEKLGMDLERLLYVRPETMEEAIDIYDAIFRTGELDLIVLDSIASMTPRTEVVKSAEEWQQGLAARLMGKMARKQAAGATMVARDYHRLTTHIWINQLREKIGVVFGDNRVMSAGNAQKFTASVIVDIWASDWEKETRDTDMIKDFQTTIGKSVLITCKTLKNHTAPPQQTGSYTLIVSGDDAGKIDEEKYFLAQAEKYGLFRSTGEGNKKRWYVGKNEEFKTKAEAIARMAEPQTYQVMRDILLKYMTGQVVDARKA